MILTMISVILTHCENYFHKKDKNGEKTEKNTTKIKIISKSDKNLSKSLAKPKKV